MVNASYYKISPNISQQMRAYAETQTTYAADPLKCRHLDCMTKDKLLFDLSWDVTESNDLSWRFSAETDELYETLRTYSNRTHVPVEPKFFEDQNEEAKIDDVWTPWLLNSTEVWQWYCNGSIVSIRIRRVNYDIINSIRFKQATRVK